MAYASITYTSASGTTFALTNSSGDPIEYLRQADIKVFLNGTLQAVTTDYTFNSAGTAIVFNTSVSGATIIIQRITDVDTPAVDFTPGSTLVASDLNNASDQTLFGLQELRDEISFGGGVSDGDKGEIVVASSGTLWSIDTGVITEAKLANAAVTEIKIGTGAVVEAKLATGAVTETKIGTGAVTSTKILNETILDIDINPSAAITGTKIQAATTSNVGTVQLTNSTSSTSTTTAATPNAVKTAKDAADTAQSAADTAQSAANTAQSAANAAQTTANAALPKAGGTMTGVITYATTQPRLVSGTAVASTSGTSIEFTSIPSWVKRITVMFSGVSTNGTALVNVQLGSTTYQTTAYTSTVALGGTYSTSTFGFITSANTGVPEARNGIMTIANISGNTWVMGSTVGVTVNNSASSGTVTLSGVLDRLRIIGSNTGSPVDTFDAGSINIMYEG